MGSLLHRAVLLVASAGLLPAQTLPPELHLPDLLLTKVVRTNQLHDHAECAVQDNADTKGFWLEATLKNVGPGVLPHEHKPCPRCGMPTLRVRMPNTKVVTPRDGETVFHSHYLADDTCCAVFHGSFPEGSPQELAKIGPGAEIKFRISPWNLSSTTATITINPERLIREETRAHVAEPAFSNNVRTFNLITGLPIIDATEVRASER